MRTIYVTINPDGILRDPTQYFLRVWRVSRFGLYISFNLGSKDRSKQFAAHQTISGYNYFSFSEMFCTKLDLIFLLVITWTHNSLIWCSHMLTNWLFIVTLSRISYHQSKQTIKIKPDGVWTHFSESLDQINFKRMFLFGGTVPPNY